MYREIAPNMHLFDCRHYILPGDKILYESIKACDSPSQVDRYTTIKYEAIVSEVFEKFVYVKLKKVKECVNRWDIIKINDRPVGNVSGYFGGMSARA